MYIQSANTGMLSTCTVHVQLLKLMVNMSFGERGNCVHSAMAQVLVLPFKMSKISRAEFKEHERSSTHPPPNVYLGVFFELYMYIHVGLSLESEAPLYFLAFSFDVVSRMQQNLKILLIF